MTSISPFLDAVSKVSTLKKTQTVLPIARKEANVTPLLVGDDLSLRTSLTSPVAYDRDLSKLLQKHSEFIEENENIKLSYTDFCKELSNVDKLPLIWALYKSTYEILAKGRKIKCPECKHEFSIDIDLDDLIHDDTYTLWEQTDDNGDIIPFFKYRYVIKVEYDDYIYEFNTRLPSIRDNNQILGMLSTEILQSNLEKIGSVLTKPQQMAVLFDAMRLTSKSGQFESVETSSLQEILMTLQEHIPSIIAEEFFDQYNDHFGDYAPNFYKEVACPDCKHNFNYEVDLEAEFFGRSLFGRRESV